MIVSNATYSLPIASARKSPYSSDRFVVRILLALVVASADIAGSTAVGVEDTCTNSVYLACSYCPFFCCCSA